MALGGGVRRSAQHLQVCGMHRRRARNPVAVLAFAAFLASIPNLAHAEQAASGTSTFSIEQAIDIAKRCVLERNISLVGSFIESARLERNPRGDRGPYWLVTWAYSREVKGGQVFVSVFPSQMCEITYGE